MSILYQCFKNAVFLRDAVCDCSTGMKKLPFDY